MAHDAPYHPIDCALHDELQLRALRRTRVGIRVQDGSGPPEELNGVVVDVLSRDGAEYLVLEGGREIRLDRLVEVDGIPFADAC